MKFAWTQVGVTALLLGVAAGCSSRTAAGSTPATPSFLSSAAAQVPAPAQTEPMHADPPHHMVQDPVAPAATAPKTTGAEAMRAIPCTARDVVLKPGEDSSDFNGMNHSGTYLTLTNKSRSACSVPGLPKLTFLDANGPVATQADLAGAKFMHPGPVVLPLVLQPKQSVTTSARWVSGPVYSNNLCYKVTGVSLALREGGAHTALLVQMCGDRDKGVHYDLQRYGATAK